MVKAEDVLRTIREKNIEMIDVHIIDLPGTWQHVSLPVSEVDEDTFTNGIPFDGSSLRGFRGIEESDMLMIPDADTMVVDPFASVPTLSLVADITDPQHVPYQRDPRRIAHNAEEFLQASGIADTSFWGPELEFFIFDTVRYINQGHHAAYLVDSSEGFWNSNAEGSLGHTIRNKEGYFPVPPLDSTAALRTAMVKALQSVGVRVEMHHHEVATAGQGEIDLRFNTLTKQADTVMMYKYMNESTAMSIQLVSFL